MWTARAALSRPIRVLRASCLTLIVAACGQSDSTPPVSPAAPTPVPPPIPTVGTLTLSGVVAENGIPVGNARVGVDGTQLCSSGCTFRQFPAGSSLTDASGRYQITFRPPEDTSVTVWATASKDGYVQQCVAKTTMRTDTSLDVPLTSLANLSVSRPRSPTGSRSVSGVVFEITPAGRQPVVDAWVGWDALVDWVVAETRSDAAGRYMLCGLPMEPTSGLFALKVGYSNVSYASVPAGGDTVVDIQITRR